jgi:hypothetical protein
VNYALSSIVFAVALLLGMLLSLELGRRVGVRRRREHEVERFHLLAAELPHPVELSLELGIVREIPGHGISSSVGPIRLGPTAELRGDAVITRPAAVHSPVNA